MSTIKPEPEFSGSGFVERTVTADRKRTDFRNEIGWNVEVEMPCQWLYVTTPRAANLKIPLLILGLFIVFIGVRTIPSSTCDEGFHFLIEVLIISLRGYRFIENEQYGPFTLLFWRERHRNVSRFTTHVSSHCSSYQIFSVCQLCLHCRHSSLRNSLLFSGNSTYFLCFGTKTKGKFFGIYWAFLESLSKEYFQFNPCYRVCYSVAKGLKKVTWDSTLFAISPKVSEERFKETAVIETKQNKKQFASMHRSTIPATCAVMSSVLQVFPLWQFQPKQTQWTSSTFSPSRNEVENWERKLLLR